MPDMSKDSGETFAQMIADGEVIIGGKYGNDNDSDIGKGGKSPKPRPAPMRPKYDGGTRYLANGVDERMLRQLRRNPPEDEIDLHGLTIDAATTALADFVAEAQRRGLRDIEVIHGKGAGALKSAARRWLAQCPEVLAFTEINNNPGAIRTILRG